MLQYFLRDQLIPENGRIIVPTLPDMGMALDESKIEGRRELRWSQEGTSPCVNPAN